MKHLTYVSLLVMTALLCACSSIEGDEAQIVYKHLLNYITPHDYEAARQYLPNPEEYDFYKILNWERN